MKKLIVTILIIVCMAAVTGCGTNIAQEGNIEESIIDATNNDTNEHTAENVVTTETLITIEEAEAIAYAKANVAKESVSYSKTELDYDDGISIYQVEFVVGELEYDVEVNAITGAIVEYEVESIYD
ncbi:MAG: PepSY domain-containing protein [Suipraeoptans sp.]